MALLSLVLWPSAAARAQDATDLPWISRMSIGRVFVDSRPAVVPVGDQAADVSADDGMAVHYDISRKISRGVFVQAGLGYWTFPSEMSGSPSPTLDGFSAVEYHLGVVYEFSHLRGLDIYGGPMVLGSSSDVARVTGITSLRDVKLSSSTGIGVQGGIRIQGCLCRRVAVDVNVRWNRLRPQVSGGDVLTLNPVTLSVGLIYRH